MIGEQIKFYRKKNLMTQQRLADILNVQKGTISMWELNKRTPDVATLVKIANAFKIDTSELIVQSKKEEASTTPICEKQKRCIKIIQQLTGLRLEKAESYLTAMLDIQNA